MVHAAPTVIELAVFPAEAGAHALEGHAQSWLWSFLPLPSLSPLPHQPLWQPQMGLTTLTSLTPVASILHNVGSRTFTLWKGSLKLREGLIWGHNVTDLLAVNKTFFPTYCLSHALKVAFLNDPLRREAGLLLLRQRLTVSSGPWIPGSETREAGHASADYN